MSSASPSERVDFTWSDEFVLGFAEMDQVHQEFVEVVAALLVCDNLEFPRRLDVFQKHIEVHFASEDEWMIDTSFPARECHIAEHAAVLRSTAHVRELVEQGDLVIGREFVLELVRWFPGHAQYLDSALAHWMFNRKHGGKPVVLRRSFGTHTT